VTPYLIPTQPQAQQIQITLGTVAYNLVLRWNVPNASWMMDILDDNGDQIVSGIPAVPGEDLLTPFAYLGIGGSVGAGEIQVQTASNTFAVPTYANLGSDGNLYWLQ
jgi:hypothetical protein